MRYKIIAMMTRNKKKVKTPKKRQFMIYPPDSLIDRIMEVRQELDIEGRTANRIAVEIIETYLPAWAQAERMKRANAGEVANAA